MPLADPPRPSMDLKSPGDIADYLIGFVRWLADFINHMDSLNVGELDAGTVIVYDLDGGPGTITLTKDGLIVNNGTFDTFTVDINGNVTMTSAVVRSSTGYPRVELNSNTNLIAAYQTANESIQINPNSFSGDPEINFFHGGGTSKGIFKYLSPDVVLVTPVGSTGISISSGNNLNLSSNNTMVLNCNALTMNGTAGVTATIPYVKNLSGTTPIFGNLVFRNGILINYT